MRAKWSSSALAALESRAVFLSYGVTEVEAAAAHVTLCTTRRRAERAAQWYLPLGRQAHRPKHV